jgi:hypothetical protein
MIMTETADQAEGIRWGRAFLAALVVEVVLAIGAAPVALMSATPVSVLNAAIPPASFIVSLLVVLWLFRRTERPVANGVATGIMSLVIYLVLALIAYWLAPEQADFSQAADLPYLASHALKILGGAAGGYLITRRRAGAIG